MGINLPGLECGIGGGFCGVGWLALGSGGIDTHLSGKPTKTIF